MNRLRITQPLLTILLSLALVSSAMATNHILDKNDPNQYNLGLGRVIFTGKCVKCHAKKESGAPQLGEVDDWKDRLKSPLSTLIDHALHGHGKMPPKGGLRGLSDRQVSAAVAYVVDRGKLLFVETNGKTVPLFDQICHEEKQPESCQQQSINNSMLLQMLWLITGQTKPPPQE